MSANGLISSTDFRQLTHGDYANQLSPWENHPPPQIPAIGPYAAGLMFWFTQKKFVGSYFLWQQGVRNSRRNQA